MSDAAVEAARKTARAILVMLTGHSRFDVDDERHVSNIIAAHTEGAVKALRAEWEDSDEQYQHSYAQRVDEMNAAEAKVRDLTARLASAQAGYANTMEAFMRESKRTGDLARERDALKAELDKIEAMIRHHDHESGGCAGVRVERDEYKAELDDWRAACQRARESEDRLSDEVDALKAAVEQARQTMEIIRKEQHGGWHNLSVDPEHCTKHPCPIVTAALTSAAGGTK